jgi:hypothetical protein
MASYGPSHRIVSCFCIGGLRVVANTDTPASNPPDLRALVLETALIMAEEKGSWSAVRLHDVADRLLVGQAAGKVPRPSER